MTTTTETPKKKYVLTPLQKKNRRKYQTAWRKKNPEKQKAAQERQNARKREVRAARRRQVGMCASLAAPYGVNHGTL